MAANTETFEGGQQSGWTLADGSAAPVDTTPNDGFSDFLGRLGGSGGTEQVSKTYTFAPSSNPTTIAFDFNKIDSWDEGYGGGYDSFNVFLNGEKAIDFAPVGFSGDDNAPGGSNGASGTFSAGSVNGTYTITSSGPDTDLGFGQTTGYYGKAFQDRVYHVELNLDATPASVRLGFGSTLDQDVSDESYGIDNVTTDAVCFARGSAIRVVRDGSEQDVPVEHLRVGDEAVTASGARRPIRWIGHRDFPCRGRRDAMPVRIAAHAFGEGRPARDLRVSPGHAICIDVVGEVLIPAGSLLNGSTIVQEDVEDISYWHVELDSHDILLAEGLPAESYLDLGNRGFFDQGTVVDFGRAPDADPVLPTRADYCRPFHHDDALVTAVRAQLRRRAEALGWTLSRPDAWADVYLDVDGSIIEPKVRGLSACFELPAPAQDVWLVGPTSVPCHVSDNPDVRALGCSLSVLRLDDGLSETRLVELDDPLLNEGFHAVSPGHRWTTGRARLPAALFNGLEGGVFLRIDLSAPALPRWQAPDAAMRSQVEDGTPQHLRLIASA